MELFFLLISIAKKKTSNSQANDQDFLLLLIGNMWNYVAFSAYCNRKKTISHATDGWVWIISILTNLWENRDSSYLWVGNMLYSRSPFANCNKQTKNFNLVCYRPNFFKKALYLPTWGKNTYFSYVSVAHKQDSRSIFIAKNK